MRGLLWILMLLPLELTAHINVDRVWQQGDWGMVLVTYTNRDNRSYETAVTIKCVAFDQKKNRVGVNERSLYAYLLGPIKPGFSDTVEIPIALNGAKFGSAQCNEQAR